jgi:phosphoribosylformimino-5-aminoimidazole carboxamide ribonucleotide (ProFAR) isomerase
VLFIPAIDLIGGKCIHLLQGDFAKKVQYPIDPVETALAFQAEGAQQIHVVDLDAARAQVDAYNEKEHELQARVWRIEDEIGATELINFNAAAVSDI